MSETRFSKLTRTLHVLQTLNRPPLTPTHRLKIWFGLWKNAFLRRNISNFYAVISEVWGGNFSGCSDCLLSPFLNYLVSLTNREAIKYYCRQYLKEFRLFDMRLPLHIRTKHTCYLRFFHYLTNTWEILKKKLSVNSHKCIENCCKNFRPFRAFFP